MTTDQQQYSQQQDVIPLEPRGVPNPFENSQFAGVRIPDIPLQQSPTMIDALLNDGNVPEEVRLKFWHAFARDNTLSFLDLSSKRSKLLNYDISKLDTLFSTPYYDYTFEQEGDFNKVRHIFETKLDRALVANGKNERIMMATQMQEQRHIQEMDTQNQHHGFWKKLLGRGSK